MFKEKILSNENLEGFDFEKTKKKVTSYFATLEKLEWEYAKLNAQKGIAVNCDFTKEYQKQPYSPMNKDVFNISQKENKEDELKKYISSYYWAISVLSETERIYLKECFINHMYQDELVDLLGFSSRDSDAFRRLRRSAIFKFADFLNLVVRIKEDK